MKRQIRVIGIDDAPFRFEGERTLVIGVVMRAPMYVEGVLSESVEVDGNDSTERIISMINKSRFREQLKAVMLDSGCLAGFNVVDLECVHETLKKPVISITKDKPDLSGIKCALQKHFPDWKERFRHLSKPMTESKHLPYRVYFRACGISNDEAESLISRFIVRGAIPEPIRVAHIIASGVTTGESKKG
jgi:endonuclease V-like protein UPF0215 family